MDFFPVVLISTINAAVLFVAVLLWIRLRVLESERAALTELNVYPAPDCPGLPDIVHEKLAPVIIRCGRKKFYVLPMPVQRFNFFFIRFMAFLKSVDGMVEALARVMDSGKDMEPMTEAILKLGHLQTLKAMKGIVVPMLKHQSANPEGVRWRDFYLHATVYDIAQYIYAIFQYHNGDWVQKKNTDRSPSLIRFDWRLGHSAALSLSRGYSNGEWASDPLPKQCLYATRLQEHADWERREGEARAEERRIRGK